VVVINDVDADADADALKGAHANVVSEAAAISVPASLGRLNN
jgi:hypothetical protein